MKAVASASLSILMISSKPAWGKAWFLPLFLH